MNRWFPHLVSILVLLVTTRAAEGQAAFTARLSGPQDVPGVVTTAAGTACLMLTSAGVQFFVTVEGLSGPITAIHIHNAPAGVNGPVVRTLTGNLWGNTAEGLWRSTDAEPLTAALIDELLKGNLYVNVHTAANPGGEIRGQIAVSGGVHFTANLDGNQENPPLTVAATGTGAFTLTEEALIYKITVSGLTGAPTAAHIHTAAIGVNGPVTITILPNFVGNTATGTVVLTAAQRRDLISGNMYVNVHTAANPGGEIRGQINLGGGFGFSARLDGSQEVPANASAGTATASLTLTPSGLLVDLTATGLSGPITAAHFHNAATGVNGPVVRTLTGDFIAGTTTASALWRYDDPEPLTPALVAELLAMMMSRRREYLADASGAELTRNPMGLARALEKIDAAVAPTRAIRRGTAHFCIADPLGRRVNFSEGVWSDWFASHPPMWPLPYSEVTESPNAISTEFGRRSHCTRLSASLSGAVCSHPSRRGESSSTLAESLTAWRTDCARRY